MTITYTLWQGSQLLAVNQKANKPEEILAVIAEMFDEEGNLHNR